MAERSPIQWSCSGCCQSFNLVVCCSCLKIYHKHCENLTDAHLAFLRRHPRSYICFCCTKTSDNLYDFSSALHRLSSANNLNSYKSIYEAARLEEILLRDVPKFQTNSSTRKPLQVDSASLGLLSKCEGIGSKKPVRISGAGCSLFQALSVAVTGGELGAKELQLRCCVELLLQENLYTNIQQSLQLNSISPSYEEAYREGLTSGNCRSAWYFLVAATVLEQPVVSLYPQVNLSEEARALNMTFRPSSRENWKNKPVFIMWSRAKDSAELDDNSWSPNHFVPLLEDSELDDMNSQAKSVEETEMDTDSTFNNSDADIEEIWKRKRTSASLPPPKRPNLKSLETSASLPSLDESDVSYVVFGPGEISDSKENNDSPTFIENMSEYEAISDSSVQKNVDISAVKLEKSAADPSVVVKEAKAKLPRKFAPSCSLLGKAFMNVNKLLHTVCTVKPQGKQIPPGKKENVFFVIDNTSNIQRRKHGAKSQHADDCGPWVSSRQSTKRSYFQLMNGNLRTLYNHGKFCNVKMGKRVPVEPQPHLSELFIQYKFYSMSKLDSGYRRRITWFEQLPGMEDSLKNVAIVEYIGLCPIRGVANTHVSELLYSCPIALSKPQVLKQKFLTTDEIYKLICTEEHQIQSIPPGTKENVYFLMKDSNRINAYIDDCGMWNYEFAVSNRTDFMETESGMVSVQNINGKYCHDNIQQLDPQPAPADILVFHQFEAALKEDGRYKKRVSWFSQISHSPYLCQLLVVEYLGTYPTTAPEEHLEMDKISHVDNPILALPNISKLPQDICTKPVLIDTEHSDEVPQSAGLITHTTGTEHAVPDTQEDLLADGNTEKEEEVEVKDHRKDHASVAHSKQVVKETTESSDCHFSIKPAEQLQMKTDEQPDEVDISKCSIKQEATLQDNTDALSSPRDSENDAQIQMKMEDNIDVCVSVSTTEQADIEMVDNGNELTSSTHTEQFEIKTEDNLSTFEVGQLLQTDDGCYEILVVSQNEATSSTDGILGQTVEVGSTPEELASLLTRASHTAPAAEQMTGDIIPVVDSSSQEIIEVAISNPNHQLPNGRFLDMDAICQVLLNETIDFDSVPPGKKENVYFVVNNKHNCCRKLLGKTNRFEDDCGAWCTRSSSTKKLEFLYKDNKVFFIHKSNGLYFHKKGSPLDPQPTPGDIGVQFRYYNILKRDPQYKKRITWFEHLPGVDPAVCQRALAEYVGKYPNTVSVHGNSKRTDKPYTRTASVVLEEIAEKSVGNKPKEVFNELSRSEESSRKPRDLKQVQNTRFQVRRQTAKKSSTDCSVEVLPQNIQHLGSIITETEYELQLV